MLVRIDRPFAIDGVPCARLVAWLLAATVHRLRQGGVMPPVVHVDAVRQQISRPGGLAMALSRAFAVLAQHGIELGWGPRTELAVASLPVRGRVHGPFWIRDDQAERLGFVTGRGPAGEEDLARFLGWSAGQGSTLRPDTAWDAQGEPEEPLDLPAWYGLIDARQAIEERLYDPAAADDPAASARAEPGSMLLEIGLGARGGLARQWALFVSAQQARRHNDVARARRLLEAALALPATPGGPRGQAVVMLCELGLLWCDYQARDFSAVAVGLARFERHGGRNALSPHALAWPNPRVACEFHNLRALWMRATLDAAPAPQRAQRAARILADLHRALVCALEADAFTLLESVAANLGYTLWLLEPVLPAALAHSGSRLEAIRWILLSEWLCQRHGLAGGSAWNLISVCRVARGAGRAPARARRLAHDSVARLSLAQVREAAGHTAALLGAPRQVRRWSDVTAALAETAATPGSPLPPLQRCAAWVEHAWSLADESRLAQAEPWMARIEGALGQLVRKDRSFFTAELRALRRLVS